MKLLMDTKSWTYLYLKQRSGGIKSFGTGFYGLLSRLAVLLTMLIFGVMLGVLQESDFLPESSCLIIGLLLVFILDMILEEDRTLLLPFLSREPREKVVRRELLLNIFSLANLNVTFLFLPLYLFVASEDSAFFPILFAIVGSYSIGGIIWQFCARLKQKGAGIRFLRPIAIGIAGTLVTILFAIQNKIPGMDVIAGIGTPAAAAVLAALFALSSLMSKKVISEDLYNIYSSNVRDSGIVKRKGKAAFSSLPAATGYLFRCPGIRSQFFSITLLMIANIINLRDVQPYAGIALCSVTGSCLVLPFVTSYMSNYIGGMFTRPDIMKKVLDASFIINAIITTICSTIGACFLYFMMDDSILPAIALCMIGIGPVSFLSLIRNIYPSKFNIWDKRRKSSASTQSILLSLATLAIIATAAFIIPINEKYFSWVFIIIGALFLPFYPMIRDFVCDEIKVRKYKIFDKMK